MNRLSTSLLTLVFLLLGGIVSLNGQVYFVNENFGTASGTTPPSGWTNNTLVGNTSFDKWVFNNPAARVANSPMSSPAAIFDSDWYSTGGGAEDVTLESPAFNTTGYSGVTLKWDQYFQTGFGGSATVEVFDGSTWNQVYFNNSTTTSNPNTQIINITSFAANKTGVKIRFRWRGDYSWWWIVDNVQAYYVVDVQPSAVLSPATLCGNSYDSIKIQLKNNSGFAINNVPVTVQVSGSLLSAGTQSATYTGSIAANSTATISFPGGNTLNGGNINIKAFTALSGDNNTANDTILYTYSVIGTPANPTVTAGSRCGAGSVVLSATPQVSTDSIVWFPTSNTSGAPLANSRVFNTPVIASNTTFYAAALRGAATGSSSLTTTTASGNAQQGVMFDIIPKKDMFIDSVSLYLTTTYTATGTYTYRVYYKTGTFIGSQLNAGAWTSNGDYTATFTGTGFLKFDIANIPMYNGQTYGFYITIITGPGTSLDYTTLGGFTTYSNTDMDIYCGNGISALFGGTFSPRGFNGSIHYKPMGCASSAVAVLATVNPTAAGSSINPKSGSAGFFNGGTLSNPDFNASPDVISYNLAAPTGFNNANFGPSGTWNMTSLTVKTVNGYTVPSSMYSFVNPNSSGAGVFNLNTDTTFNDSLIKISMKLVRLDNGCDTTIERYVYIAPRPKASYTNNTVCEGDKTLFTNTSTIQVGNLTYMWNFGNGVTSNDADPLQVLGVAGTYNVKLVVTSDKGYKDSVTKTIAVYQIPTANFTFANACEGTAVSMTDNSSLPSGTPTYSWDYGDGSAVGSGSTTSRTYVQPGIYMVKLTVDVNGCKDDVAKYVTQAPRAVPAFTYSTLQCDNANVSFTNGSTPPAFGNVSYTWKFGDGSQAASLNSNHTYNSFQQFNVTLVSQTELGCVDSTTQTITLKESPLVDFNITGSTCNGDILNFANTSTVPVGATNIYDWDFGDAVTSTDANPSHQYAGPGSKTVTLTTTSSNGCSGQKVVNVNINLKPVADFVTSDVCEGQTAQFTNNSSIADNSNLAYSWNLDGFSATSTDTSVVYTGSGAKNVSLVVTANGGCTDTATQTLNINPKPVVDILITSKLSMDGSFNFTSNATGTKYYWLFGDGGVDSVKTTSYKYLADGRYTVRLVVTSDKGCVGTHSQDLFVNALGVKAVGIDGSVAVYPNPGAGNFALEFTGINANEVVAVTVLNNLGQKVADVNVANVVNNKLDVNITNQAAGIYFIQVETKQGSASFKYNLVK